MASELRVRCFWNEDKSDRSQNGFDHGEGRRAGSRDLRGTRAWNSTGDRSQVLASLLELVDRLETDSSDYVVKVFVHRRVDDFDAPSEQQARQPSWGREPAATGARSVRELPIESNAHGGEMRALLEPRSRDKRSTERRRAELRRAELVRREERAHADVSAVRREVRQALARG